MVTVRTASASDAGSIRDIYAPFVLSTAISFETVVPSGKEMGNRIERCLEKFPWVVCEIDNRLAGYVYASPHREREAYQWTCESSIYLHQFCKGKGIGFLLYQLLFVLLRKQGFVNVYGGITLPNEASVKLHEKCGFEQFAVYDNIGFKSGSWHKVGWWKLQLHDYLLNPPPPVQFMQLDQNFVSSLYRQTADKIQLKLID